MFVCVYVHYSYSKKEKRRKKQPVGWPRATKMTVG
jgi:hypothetical protein